MIARNCFLPCLGFDHLPIFQQFSRVFVVEVFLIGRYRKMSAPNERTPFQRKDALRFTEN